jgi:hypothetical protein
MSHFVELPLRCAVLCPLCKWAEPTRTEGFKTPPPSSCPTAGGQYQAKCDATNTAIPCSDCHALDTNANGYLDQSDDMYSPYYPGNQYVDWVGLSVYHFGGERGGGREVGKLSGHRRAVCWP